MAPAVGHCWAEGSASFDQNNPPKLMPLAILQSCRLMPLAALSLFHHPRAGRTVPSPSRHLHNPLVCGFLHMAGDLPGVNSTHPCLLGSLMCLCQLPPVLPQPAEPVSRGILAFKCGSWFWKEVTREVPDPLKPFKGCFCELGKFPPAGVPLWRSGLRIWSCHCCGLGRCYGEGSVPSLGTSTYLGCSPQNVSSAIK